MFDSRALKHRTLWMFKIFFSCQNLICIFIFYKKIPTVNKTNVDWWLLLGIPCTDVYHTSIVKLTCVNILYKDK